MTTNNNLNVDEYIREADKTVCDQLIPARIKDEFEIQMEEVLYNSLQEYQNCQKEMDEFENHIKKEYEEECARRKLLFADMFQIIKRVSAHDIKIKDVLEILEPIVEMYVEQIINSYEVDNESYNVIFKTLSLIRLKPVMIENLKSIITTN
jgi:hypothetical protein